MLLQPLVSTIETIKERIATHGAVLRQNETRTRMALIDPLLGALGWDTSDPALVTPEYRTGGWADYALIGVRNKPAAIIEAKRLGSVVENHLEQAVGYCIQEGIAYAGVTDGNHWQLYRTFEPVPLVEKLVLDISIADTPAHDVALKLLLLWRPNLSSGQPVEASAPVFGHLPELPVEPNEPTLVAHSEALPPRSRLSTVPTSIIPVYGKWQPISAVSPGKRERSPTAIKFGESEPRPIKDWWQVLTEVAEWLVEDGTPTAEKLPIEGMGFINSSPDGPRGGRFGGPREVSGGIYLNVKLSLKDIVKHSNQLLDRFDVNPETVELRFE